MKLLAFIVLLVVAFVAANPVPDPDPQYLARYSSGLPLVYSSPVYSRVVASPYATYSRSGLYYGNGIYDGLGTRVYTL